MIGSSEIHHDSFGRNRQRFSNFSPTHRFHRNGSTQGFQRWPYTRASNGKRRYQFDYRPDRDGFDVHFRGHRLDYPVYQRTRKCVASTVATESRVSRSLKSKLASHWKRRKMRSCICQRHGRPGWPVQRQAEQSGDEIIFFDECYHRSREYCRKHLSRFGIRTRVVARPVTMPRWKRQSTPNTRTAGQRIAYQSSPQHSRS